MPVIASLLVNVGAKTGGAEVGISQLIGRLGKGGLAGAAGLAVEAVAGIGIGAIKMAGDFQSGMTTLVTGAGESENVVRDKTGKIVGGIQMVSDGLLQMAVDTATSTKQLTDGMFMVESGGYRGAQGLDVLRVAAEGAKVGNADLGTTATAVVGIMNNYKSAHITAAQAMNILTLTVQDGLTKMQDLAGAMPNVLSTASATGVSMTDVAAAMATMTSQTVPAANAATYLRQMLISLAAPAKAGQKALADIGLTTSEVSADMKKSLPDTLKLIMTHLAETYKVGSPQYVEALKAIAGGSKQMQGMLDLTGDHLKVFKGDVVDMSGKVKKAGNSILGWGDVQQNFNFKLDKAKEVVETFMIKLGTGLLPIAGKLADFFSSTMMPALSKFADFVSQTVGPAVDALGGLLGGTPAKVVPATKAYTDQEEVLRKVHGRWIDTTTSVYHAGTAMKTIPGQAGPIQDVLSTIGSIMSDDVMPVIKGFGQILTGTLVPALKKAWDTISPTLIPAIKQLGQFINTSILPAARNMAQIFATQIMPALSQLAKFIITNVVPAIESLVGWFVNNVEPVLVKVVGIIVQDVVPVFEQIFTTISTKVVPALERIWNIVAPKLIPVLQFLGGIFKNVVGPAISFVIGLFGNIINTIGNVLGWIDSISGKLKQFGGFLSGAFGDAISGVKTAFQTVFSDLWSIVKAPLNAIIGGINTVINALDSIHFSIPSWVPFAGGKSFGISIPDIPTLAQGGDIVQPGYVLVGEAGPELLHLPAGAQVAPLQHPSPAHGLPAGMQQAFGAAHGTANGQPLQVSLYLDGRKFAEIMTKLQPAVIRNGTGTRHF